MSTRKEVLRSPLHHPAFRRLWLGLVISRLGDQFTVIALIWFVLQLTGSGVAIGLLVFCIYRVCGPAWKKLKIIRACWGSARSSG